MHTRTAAHRYLPVLFALLLAGCQTLPPASVPAKKPASAAVPVVARTPATTAATPAPEPAAAPVVATPVAAPPEPYRNVYVQEKDSVPVAAPDIDYHAIPEPVPVPEPRGKYGNKSPYTVNGKRYTVLADARGYREEGMASWYGQKFQGFRTSSFERYDMYKMTAAHKSLPIPSYVRVTNLANDRSVIVRVNDRGPFHSGRIIDLSWAAAQKLGYASAGTARVRVEAIDPVATLADAPSAAAAATATGADPTATTTAPRTPVVPAPAAGFYVQLGAFAFPDAARRLGEQARASVGEPVHVSAGEDLLHRVRVGPYEDRVSAERVREMLQAATIGTPALVFIPAATP